MNNDVYIYYSGATDKTGSALAEALDIKSGRITPTLKSTKVVIGWGAKTDKDINFGASVTILNHPNAIRANRDKLKALNLMTSAKVAVAPFAAADQVIGQLDSKAHALALPVIGRTNYHQGGANFWTCLTRTHVNDVIGILNGKLKKKGYFQNYIDIDAEYRLHIVNGELIYAQRKVPRDDLKDAHVEQQSDKIRRMAEKNKKTLDEATLKYALEYQGSKIAGADNIIKSNTRGWKFSNVNLDKVNKNLLDEANNALKAVNLQFGAVDCALDTNGKAWIIEVNTGPGLEGTPFKKYVAAFQKAINDILKPKPEKKKEVAPKKAEAKAAAPAAKKSSGEIKVDPEKLRMLADLMDNADDGDRDAISRAAKRMFE